MNRRLAAGHAAVAAVFTVAWQTAIAMPAGPADTALVVTGLLAPSAFAGISLALMGAGQDRTTQTAPVPTPRPAVTAARRRELTR